MKILSFIKRVLRLQQNIAADDLQWEIDELRHVFALLTMARFSGLPGTPLPLALELLPEMEEEVLLMLNKIPLAGDALSHQFGKLDAT